MNKANKKVEKKGAFTIRRLIILALFLMVLIIFLWIFLRDLTVKGLINGITNLESQGYEIGHGGLTIEGFPLTVQAGSHNISVRAPISQTPDLTKNWSLITDRVVVQNSVFIPLTWNIHHTGKMRIDMRGADGERYMFDLVPGNIDARADVSLAGKLKQAKIKIGAAGFDSLIGTPPVISKLGGGNAELKVSGDIGYIKANARDLRLSPRIPNVLNSILGRHLTLIELDANVENWSLIETSDIDAWMMAGSQINSDHWAINWGDVDVVGNFSFTFKDGLPEGSLTMRFKNPDRLINKVIDARLVPQKYAGAIKGLIALNEVDADNRKSIEFNVKNGAIKLGFIPIYQITK